MNTGNTYYFIDDFNEFCKCENGMKNDESIVLETYELIDDVNRLVEENKQLKKENEQLKSQLYCDDEEGICNICKHHYLIKDDESELGYYNSRCKKGHYECARVSLKYCEDFEKELEE